MIYDKANSPKCNIFRNLKFKNTDTFYRNTTQFKSQLALEFYTLNFYPQNVTTFSLSKSCKFLSQYFSIKTPNKLNFKFHSTIPKKVRVCMLSQPLFTLIPLVFHLILNLFFFNVTSHIKYL